MVRVSVIGSSLINIMIQQNCQVLTVDERQSAYFYMNNVQLNILICRPKDLYEVSYSLLLQIFGTIVTYTVIILQSA